MKLPVKEGLKVEGAAKLQTKQIKMSANSQAKVIAAMSDAIYKDKPGSMIREVVTNAWDANKEAGSKDPVYVKVTEQQITIKDSGNGISPKLMEDVWLNLGESTKTMSN